MNNEPTSEGSVRVDAPVRREAIMLTLKDALKEVAAAVVECEEARDAAARRLDRLKEQERSLRQLIRESA